MWLLGRILPAMVGHFVPEDDEYRQNFLLLMQITDYLLSPWITQDDAAFLQCQIAEHHQQFVQLYPSRSIIPKMHYIVHMPRLMISFIGRTTYPHPCSPQGLAKRCLPHITESSILLFGVNECSKGTNRQTRQSSDLNSVATIIFSLNTDIRPVVLVIVFDLADSIQNVIKPDHYL